MSSPSAPNDPEEDVDPAILELLREDGKDRAPTDEQLAAFLSWFGAPAESWEMEWDDEPYYWGTASWFSGDRTMEVGLVVRGEVLRYVRGRGLMVREADGTVRTIGPRMIGRVRIDLAEQPPSLRLRGPIVVASLSGVIPTSHGPTRRVVHRPSTHRWMPIRFRQRARERELHLAPTVGARRAGMRVRGRF